MVDIPEISVHIHDCYTQINFVPPLNKNKDKLKKAFMSKEELWH